MASELITTTPDCEIVCSRIVHAPVAVVYTAWTDPEHLKNWWGPKGFTNTFFAFDLRPGGTWRFMMHGPDKGNYPNECVFIKIEKPALIAWNRISKPIFQAVATFEAVSGDRTKVVFKQVFHSARECNKVKPFAVDKNEENMDRLENELRKMTASG